MPRLDAANAAVAADPVEPPARPRARHDPPNGLRRGRVTPIDADAGITRLMQRTEKNPVASAVGFPTHEPRQSRRQRTHCRTRGHTSTMIRWIAGGDKSI